MNEKSREQYLEDWKNSGLDEQLDDERFSQLFDRIQQKIELGENRNPKRIITKSGINVVSTWLTRAAAILLIPVLLFSYYTLTKKVELANEIASISVDSLEIEAPFGSRTVFQLSDGTVVHLNYGSKLKYPIVFLGETREVCLSGEGYFKVSHNPSMPFIVKTSDLNIKALGTSFNVFAYPQEKYIETTLVHGTVNLERGNGNKAFLEMIPGEHTKYDKLNGYTVTTTGKIDKYISWKDGKIIFEDTPITDVADRLSKMFNVEIHISEDIKDYNFTVTIIDEPLFQILDLMTIAAPVNYTVIPRVKEKDGTFSRQKIMFEKRK